MTRTMMKSRNPLLILIAVLAAVSLVAAACGDDDDDVGTGGDGTSEPAGDGEALPPAGTCPEGTADCDDTPGDVGAPGVAEDEPVPGAAGACLEGTVDCDDTPGDLDPPVLEPGDSDAEPTTGPLPDGGTEVEAALSMGPDDGVVAVSGHLVASPEGTYLCGALAESFPPQCGGGALELADFDAEILGDVTSAPVSNAQGVTWTDAPITLSGVVDNGVFTIDTTVMS